MKNLEFVHPGYFYLLLLLIPIAAWYAWRNRKSDADIRISTLMPFKHIARGTRYYFRHVPFFIRILIFILLIIVLARPQSTNNWSNETVEGIDIMLAMDISGSMLAADFSPNRLEASKDVAIEFISGRPNDRIGLVLFSGESFTQCPLTTDHAALINLLKEAKVGIIEDQSTAIGLGLANAVKRLKDSNAKSKVVILLTDGVNNAGSIDPLTAAEIARTFGVRVYTIGIGTHGMAPYPVQDVFGNKFYQQMKVDLDENMLKKIANMTGGEYFRATGNQKLREIYSEIDKMEKSKIDVNKYSRKYERYRIFAAAAAFFLFVEIISRNTLFRSIP